MLVKGIIDEDWVNYKLASMVIEFPKCDFKCDKESGQRVCQNSALVHAPDIKIYTNKLVERYLQNPLTRAIVCQGLEPFDTAPSLYKFITTLRNRGCNDDIVIYTGYTKEELKSEIEKLKNFSNIIIKFGRFIPNMPSKFDEILGVTLASNNQYAERIS